MVHAHTTKPTRRHYDVYKQNKQGENMQLPVAIVRDVPPPKRAHPTDAGLDLYAAEQKMIHPHSHEKIRLGVKTAIPAGYVGLLIARSSLGTRDLGLANDVGIIDPDYRGELCALIQNRGRVSQIINLHERICQLVLVPIITPQLKLVERLDTTQRGTGGFGSTGQT